MINIYLDIDGVLLANEHGAAHHADEFLQYILERWPNSTYWLTTHVWRGENRAIKVLAPYLKPKTVDALRLVKPTAWTELKTEGIDFKKPFLWFDDDLMPNEETILKHYGARDCLRMINLHKNPHQLMDELVYLKQLG